MILTVSSKGFCRMPVYGSKLCLKLKPLDCSGRRARLFRRLPTKWSEIECAFAEWTFSLKGSRVKSGRWRGERLRLVAWSVCAVS
jgi:hypothetical protein